LSLIKKLQLMLYLLILCFSYVSIGWLVWLPIVFFVDFQADLTPNYLYSKVENKK